MYPIGLVITTVFFLGVDAFNQQHHECAKIAIKTHRKSQQLHMVLTPIGPFCHFQSSSTKDLEPRYEQITEQTPEFATEMQRVQLELEMGHDPDPDKLFRVSEGIEKSVQKWSALWQKLQQSSDFQTVEYRTLVQVHLETTAGLTPTSLTSMMKWQSQCMQAMALNAPPPLPPTDLDLNKLAAASNKAQNENKKSPSLTAMMNAEPIVAAPFQEDALVATDTIRDEFQQLNQQHEELIKFGHLYSTFDAKGKLLFLDQIDLVEERWDIFYKRFELMGDVLNPDFISQCEDFLKSMNLTEKEFRQLLKQAHALMRKNAEEEANSFSF